MPPTAPRTRIGAKALVMMASGRLSRTPKIRPCAHDGTGRRAAPMTKPMANRLRKHLSTLPSYQGTTKESLRRRIARHTQDHRLCRAGFETRKLLCSISYLERRTRARFNAHHRCFINSFARSRAIKMSSQKFSAPRALTNPLVHQFSNVWPRSGND